MALCGYWLRSVTVPLLIALTLAYLLEPIVARLSEHPKLSRPIVVGGMVAMLAGGFLIFVIAAVPLLVVQTATFVENMPRNRDAIERLITAVDEKMDELLPESGLLRGSDDDASDSERSDTNGEGDGGEANNDDAATPRPGESNDDENKLADGATDESPDQPADGSPQTDADEASKAGSSGRLTEFFQRHVAPNLPSVLQGTVRTTGEALRAVASLIGMTVYAAFLLFLIPFYFYFFSTGYGQLSTFFVNTIPPENNARVYDLLEKMDAAVAGFVRGRLVISAIMGVMLAIGWAFCGVPYWLILGFTTGILCAVPYLGGISIPVAVILLALAQGRLDPSDQMAWWGVLLWPTLVFAIVQLIEGYVLTPVIAGKSTNLGPVSILVAVLAGGVLMGVYGMLLAIPVAACLKILSSEVLMPRIRAWAQGHAQDILPISSD